MIDIKIFRENPEIVRESERNRFKNPDQVDRVIEFDNEWRSLLKQINEMRKERNKVSKQIGLLKKKGKNTDSLKERVSNINKDISILEKGADKALTERDKERYSIGNILAPGVPIAKTEKDNEIMRTWGRPSSFDYPVKGHTDLVEGLDLAEIQKAAQVSGSRTFYLKNQLVFLNLALIEYSLDFLVNERGFTPFWTPPFLRRQLMEGASELTDFEEQLYHDSNEDVFFIATSEQTLAALHSSELIDVDTLPRKYCGVSLCYRREAGSHGKDTKGIFRVHHFHKIEQFCFVHPDESYKMHEELIGNAEQLYQRLKLPYRVVNIASGELNDNAAKKYDLEVFFPAQNEYRELVSCSNVTDYQARKLDITTGKAGGEKEYVHTLNSTAIATERTICAILENYQQSDGSVLIPEALQQYMSGQTRLKL
ncbi:MAG: serine--tRNA ligase [Candidatus Heimdallarchaeota archaeon]